LRKETIMCLAIPGKILKVDRGSEPLMGTVSFGGVEKTVCLEWVPGVNIGDYVMVHVGFALSTVDEKEALETLEIVRQMGAGGEKNKAGSLRSGA
jgi:hydrogenase expression/formation protein HypC